MTIQMLLLIICLMTSIFFYLKYRRVLRVELNIYPNEDLLMRAWSKCHNICDVDNSHRIPYCALKSRHEVEQMLEY